MTGRTVTLKVKYADFRQITRSKSCVDFLSGKAQFGDMGRELLAQLLPVETGVRLLGLTLSGLAEEKAQQHHKPEIQMIKEQRTFDF